MRLNWLKNYNFLIFETIDSTNTEALRIAKSGASGDFVILANTQTGGRGSKGRSWISIPGNLHMTILLSVPSSSKNNSQLSFLAANAVYDAFAELLKQKSQALEIKLKWPNDILINSKKVGGLLLESISFGDRTYIAVGIGINVIEAPSITNFPATSLYDEGLMVENSDELLGALVDVFDKKYRLWLADANFSSIRKEWLKRAYRLNKVITIDDGNIRISGTFKEIDDFGSIKLQLASGEICSFSSGEVLSG
jgi:BirA family biotin operon repressor/biotin-[acetyl-CoA-carboxylase] ligase